MFEINKKKNDSKQIGLLVEGLNSQVKQTWQDRLKVDHLYVRVSMLNLFCNTRNVLAMLIYTSRV